MASLYLRSGCCHSIEPRSFLIADPNCQNCLLAQLIENLQQILAELGILNAAVENAQSRSLFSRQLFVNFPQTISTASDVVGILNLISVDIDDINKLNVLIQDIEDTLLIIQKLMVTVKIRNDSFNTFLIIINRYLLGNKCMAAKPCKCARTQSGSWHIESN